MNAQCVETIPTLITEEMNNCLPREFKFSEVYEAVFNMNPMSALGPDGFLAGFFQQN